MRRAIALLFVFAVEVFAQCGSNARLLPIGGGRVSCVPLSTLLKTDASGNVAVGTTVPGGAPASSIAIAGKYYGDGSQLSGLAGGGDMVAATYAGGGAGAPANPCATKGATYINSTPSPNTLYVCPSNGGNWLGPFARVADNITGTAAAIAGGSGGQVPFQTNVGVTGFSAGLAYNDTTKVLGLIGGFTAGQDGTATGTYKINGTTSGTVTITGADEAGTWTLKLPATAGTDGYFLKTDGSGNTSWAAGSGGMADPGSNGIVTRTALNTTGVAAASDVTGLFSGAGDYLKSDGSKGTPAGTGEAPGCRTATALGFALDGSDETDALQALFTSWNKGSVDQCLDISGVKIRADGQISIPPVATFASPPSTPSVGDVYRFTDASTDGTCAGGGTGQSGCKWSGSVWVSANPWAGPTITIRGNAQQIRTADATIAQPTTDALDLRYNGSRIVSTFNGTLRLEGINLVNGGTNGGTFVQSTLTNVLWHNVNIHGGAASPTEDVWLAGGINSAELPLTGGLSDFFQGYASYMDHNSAYNIGRMLYGRASFNAIPITNNIVWSGAGNAFELDSPGATTYNNVFQNNLVEMRSSYDCMFKLENTTGNTFISNAAADAATSRYKFCGGTNNVGGQYIFDWPLGAGGAQTFDGNWNHSSAAIELIPGGSITAGLLFTGVGPTFQYGYSMAAVSAPSAPASGGSVYFNSSTKQLCVKAADNTTSCTGASAPVGWVSPPAAPNSTGTQGQYSGDETYYYLAIDTDTWRRVAWDDTWTTVAIPAFDNDAGTYNNDVSVTITDSTGSATICYTTDGSTPAATSPGTCSTGTTYSAPVSIAATGTTLKAIGTKAGETNSGVKSAAYTLTAATPTADPAAGTYGSTQSVTLASATTGAYICYTTDNSAPTGTASSCTNGTHYTGAISVSASETIKAVAYKTDYVTSGTLTAVYTISAGGSVAWVQGKCFNGNGSADQTISFTSPTTSGNAVYVMLMATGAGDLSSVSDTGSSTYASRLAKTTSGSQWATVWSASTNSGSISDITLHFSDTNEWPNGCIAEVSGATGYDGASFKNDWTDGSTGAFNATAITTTATDLILGLYTATNTTTWTAGSGYTLGVDNTPAGMTLEYKASVASGTVTATATNSATGTGAQAIAVAIK